MRPSALLSAALFLALPLAGCLDGSTATAADLVPEARAIAEAWDADAVLEGLATVELGDLPPIVRAALAEADEDDPETQLLQYRDDNVGDGRAGAWMFAFRAGGRELLLAIDAAGKELLRHEDDTDSRPQPGLGDFEIDSDEAMRLAADHDAPIAALRGKAVAASMALLPRPTGPVWLIAVGASFDDEGQAAFAVVDATSGNVTAMEDLADAVEAPEAQPSGVRSPYYRPRGNHTFVQTETGSQRGTLSVASPDAEAPFEVEAEGHGQLRIQLSLPRSLPPTQATATLTAPDGRTLTLHFSASLGAGPATGVLDSPQQGRYKVSIHLDAGVLQQYDFAWCAPGSRMAAQDASSVCGEA